MARLCASITCILLTLSAFILIVQGLRCRVENDARSVEEFEDMVRVCLRTSISPQDKSKNKQSWNNKNNRNNRGKKKQSSNGRFGNKNSDEEDDDYDDDYGEEGKNDAGKDKKGDNKGSNQNSKGNKDDSGAGRIGSRSRRSAQYSSGMDYSSYGNNGGSRYGNNGQYPGSQGGYGFYENRRRYDNDDQTRRGYNRNYNSRGSDDNSDEDNYGSRRYKREPQYLPDSWNAGGNDRQNNGQRKGSGGIQDEGNRRGGYGNGGDPGNNWSNNGGYGNSGGYGSPNRGYGNNGGYGYNGNRGQGGGYGGQDNRWSGNGNQGGNGWNSTRGGSKSSHLANVQPCVIHCMLRQKKMLDEDSTPDKAKVMKVMSQSIRQPELRDFIQDSVNECFDNIESDDIDQKCEMSKSLMMCLEEKGKQNCEDWEIAGPSTNPDKWFPNNNNNYRPPNQRPQQWG